MKLLHVTHSLDPAVGGPAECIRQMSLAALADGHEVAIACLDDPAAPWLQDYPLPVHGCGPPRAGSYGYAPALWPWLLAHAPAADMLVAHGLWQYNGSAVRRAARRVGRPYAIFPHGMLDPWFKRSNPGKHVKKLAYWLASERANVRAASALLFTAEEERRLAHGTFPCYRATERVVGLGTAAPPEDAELQRAHFLKRFPQLAATRNLLFLGRIQAKKGCDLLIEAFATAGQGRDDLRLVMAGPDREGWRAELERLAEARGVGARLVWTGMLQGLEKWGAFRACEAFALPSHQENFGIAVAEALACGLPVLISDRINIWREVVGDGAGLVAGDDLPGTRSLLARWYALPGTERLAMGAAARRCFANRYEIRTSTRRLMAVLGELAGSAAVAGAAP